MKIAVPAGYTPLLDVRETERAIKLIKDTFEQKLAAALCLERVSAPLFVRPESGLNDDLNGVERAVQFDIADIGTEVQIVQSLAKWKRHSLAKYSFEPGRGLYTDMNAVRRDEVLDNIHSVYVDQWDWERVITKEQRTIAYLQQTVCAIVAAMCDTEALLAKTYPVITPKLQRDVFFITAQALLDQYPSLTAKEREREITREKRTVFIMQIGAKLSSGEKHDGRAPDYDDWSLNGDLLVWNDVLDDALELSSMGIRVDEDSLASQLTAAGCENRRTLTYHKDLLEGRLPLTIGGGIGQSRFCMLLLGKAHLGEVQVSEWPPAMVAACKEGNIPLL